MVYRKKPEEEAVLLTRDQRLLRGKLLSTLEYVVEHPDAFAEHDHIAAKDTWRYLNGYPEKMVVPIIKCFGRKSFPSMCKTLGDAGIVTTEEFFRYPLKDLQEFCKKKGVEFPLFAEQLHNHYHKPQAPTLTDKDDQRPAWFR